MTKDYPYIPWRPYEWGTDVLILLGMMNDDRDAFEARIGRNITRVGLRNGKPLYIGPPAVIAND